MARERWFAGGAVWVSLASARAAVRRRLDVSPSSAELWVLPLLIIATFFITTFFITTFFIATFFIATFFIATFFVFINSFYVIDVRVLPRGAERDARLRRLAVGVFGDRVWPPGAIARGSTRS